MDLSKFGGIFDKIKCYSIELNGFFIRILTFHVQRSKFRLRSAFSVQLTE